MRSIRRNTLHAGRASSALILTVLRLNRAMNRRIPNALEYRGIKRGKRPAPWPKTERHARRGNCCVRVGAGHSIRSFKVLHEQDRSASAFWFGLDLLAWQGSLLGRDTDRSTSSDP